jgi:MYXO-CTERM domain-containing protein
VVTVTSQLPTGEPGPSASASAVVNFMSPTSVSLTGFGEGGPSATPIWLGALVLLVVGLGLVMRRKLTD